MGLITLNAERSSCAHTRAVPKGLFGVANLHRQPTEESFE